MPATKPPRVLSHRNRRGETYYLHRGTTKTGRPRYYFAKTLGEGALSEMRAGFEVAESVNGVVSVRKVSSKAALIPPADADLVRRALAAHPRLRHCVSR